MSKSFGVNEKDTPSGARAVEQTVVETTAETAKPFGIKTAGDLPVSLVPISLNISGVSSAKERTLDRGSLHGRQRCGGASVFMAWTARRAPLGAVRVRRLASIWISKKSRSLSVFLAV